MRSKRIYALITLVFYLLAFAAPAFALPMQGTDDDAQAAAAALLLNGANGNFNGNGNLNVNDNSNLNINGNGSFNINGMQQGQPAVYDGADTNQNNFQIRTFNANMTPDVTYVNEKFIPDGPLDRRFQTQYQQYANLQKNAYRQTGALQQFSALQQLQQNGLQQSLYQKNTLQQLSAYQQQNVNKQQNGLQLQNALQPQNALQQLSAYLQQNTNQQFDLNGNPLPAKTSEVMDPKEISASSMFDNLVGNLPRFGMEFFEQRRLNDLTFAPVGDDYIVAPGDEIKIAVWGFAEIRANLVVARDGTLDLPQAGVIQAGGLTFKEVRSSIEKAYKRILTDFELSVSSNRLHTINVYLAGNVNQPGAYATSSMATVLDILSMAGGPSLSGTMRGIQIKRAGRKIAEIDLYRLFIHGDKKGDVRLHDGDVIFVPPVGNLVAVTGNVKRPAVYETGAKTTLEDAIRLAGGLTAGAFKGRVQIVRVKDNAVRSSFEADLSDVSKKQPVCDGDFVKIFAVPGEAVNARLEGAVNQPGVFAITPGKSTLRELISRAGGLLYTASDSAEITRTTVSNDGPVTKRMTVNIKDVVAKRTDIVLQRDDYVFVKTIPDWEVTRSAIVDGRVLHPGNYSVKRGERLSSLLERSGGYAEGAFVRGALFIRDSVRIEQQKAIDEMLVRLEREFSSAANEAVSTANSTKDKDFALVEIEQKKRLLNALKNTKATGRLIINLPEKPADLKGSAFDIEIKDGDIIVIPEHPNTVQVVGAVTAQSAFIYQPGLRVADYIEQAGGYSSSANARKSYVIRPNGSIVKVSKDTKIEEGDYIVIPEKVVFKPRLRTAQDILDILSKTVMSIASVHYIFK